MPRLILLLIGLILGPLVATAPAGAVGFQQREVPDPADRPITVGIWYPADAAATPQPLWPYRQAVAPDAPPRGTRLPVVILSHGTGGNFAGHWDTAQALAAAGFVAIAPTHTGDNIQDQGYSGTARGLAERTRHLALVLDWLLGEWPDHARLDAGRVGAFGFSAGGFTVLAAAGGTPDLTRGRVHCMTQPADPSCRLGKPNPTAEEMVATWVHDARIRAVVAAAPAVGWAFTGRGLAALQVPVQLWRGAADEVLPHPWHAELVRRALPQPPALRVVPKAGHYAFLAPCPDAMAAAVPEICLDAPGFDRVAFHRAFNAAVVGFFRTTLR